MPINLSMLGKTSYDFEGRREKEHVEIFLYSHWIIMVLKTVFYFLLVLAPIVPFFIFYGQIAAHDMTFLAFGALVGYYMILWSMYFYELMLYLLDTWIVTDERILDIVQHTFFNRTVSELDLVRVQDISVNTSGLLQTIFDFGNVDVQSAGAVNRFQFSQVAHPHLVKDKIMKLVSEAKRKHGEFSKKV